MQPSDRQLLKQLRQATGRLLAACGHPEDHALLGAMDVVLNELLLRSDREFFVNYYHRGRDLLEEGVALLATANAALRTDLGRLPAHLDAQLAMDVIASRAGQLSASLQQLVTAIGHTTDAPRRTLLRRITEWELSLFAHRLKRADPDQATAVPSVTIDRETLQIYLRRKKPEWNDLDITACQRLAGGFSKCTFLVDAVDAVNGPQPLVIRAEQPIHLMNLDGSDITNEFPVVRKAFECGIPVAEPLWLEADDRLLNARFMVSRKARGRTFGTAKGGEDRLSRAAVKDLARVLAAIHTIPLDRNAAWITGSHFGKWLDRGSTRQNTLASISYWRRQADAANIFPSPTIARSFDWLDANVPLHDAAPVFLHGDYGPHNILLDDGRVSAVLDWEIATPGDPAQDVAWFLNCTSATADRQQFLDAYRAAGGQPLNEYRLRYFDVFRCTLTPIVCSAALRLLEDNDAANIDLAVFGLQFMHEYPSRLDGAIARAEAVQHMQ